MKLFLDASAIVAMLREEEDALDLARRMDAADQLLWSPISCWESVVALARAPDITPALARAVVLAFGARYAIDTIMIGDAELAAAVDAADRYGKRSGHPAQLNMGDCFAYACARVAGARLLYKGNDFSQTDIA
ncbi:MAG: hypothetical protein A4S16_10715 [Proteobacteria bacterium SG_bin6]|nr:MAG: hypothetical protein A4S16_10715 [Proteobacteria bacterium SG_bin6]